MNSANDQRSAEKKVNTIYWFRKDLRLHDNPSLRDCVKGTASLHCVYILDPWFAGSQNVVNEGINKWRFLLQSLEDLDNSLKKLNLRLHVLQGQPSDVLPKLFNKWNIKLLAFEHDSEPFGKLRDNSIKRLAEKSNVRVLVRVSRTLLDPDALILLNNGHIPVSYQRFKALFKISHPPEISTPALTADDCMHCNFSNSVEYEDLPTPPSLEELGFESDQLEPSQWKGGETEALRRMENYLHSKSLAGDSGNKTEKLVKKLLESGNNILTPYLVFGCLSSRLLYFRLQNLHREKNQTTAISQLVWREYIYTLSTINHRFDTPEGNPNCMKLPWTSDNRLRNAWKYGKTGFPWIDAIMTQLREEGWVHQICRYSAACFLTWGDLWISWDEGMKVFDKYLIDSDWSMNAGFWMWVMSVPFFRKFSKTFDPVAFGKIIDPSGEYIRRYISVLKDFPDEFIHSPWMAPVSLQEQAGCIIGKDYPKPIVDHSSVNEVNLKRVQAVISSMTGEKNTTVTRNLFKAPLPVHKVTDQHCRQRSVNQKRKHDIDEPHVHSFRISKQSQENDNALSCCPPSKMSRSFRRLLNSWTEGAKLMLDKDMDLNFTDSAMPARSTFPLSAGVVATGMPLSSVPMTGDSNVPVQWTMFNGHVLPQSDATAKGTASYIPNSPLHLLGQNFGGMVLPLPLPLELYFRTKETEEALDTDNSYLQNEPKYVT